MYISPVTAVMTKEIFLPPDIVLEPAKRLQAGALTCLYEGGKLRYICLAQTEILRMLYPAVRDSQWGTLPCTISNEQLVIGTDTFTIQYTAVYYQEKPVYEAQYSIEGCSCNRIVFSMKGRALAAFEKNRIGLCVLHPVKECSGQPVTIVRAGGGSCTAGFPVQIAPVQPFHNVAEMHWRTADGCDAEVIFEGEVFETEDQRNWMDHSYKTYSTPQAIPFPVKVQAGDTVMQKISVTANAAAAQPSVPVALTEERISFPAIGYGRSAHQPQLTDEVINCLQKIPFHHYNVRLALDEPGWQQILQMACAEAVQLQTKLDLALVFSDAYPQELEALLELLSRQQAILLRILPLQKDEAVTPEALLNYVYPRIKSRLPGVKTGHGTRQFFTELNRQRPRQSLFDFVSFSCHPQVHATDSRSLLENLESLPDMINTAGELAAGKPVFIAPLTLKGAGHPAADSRQYSRLAACWTILALQQVAMAGSCTLFELSGEAGLVQMTAGGVQPSPVYEVLVAIQSFQPRWIIKKYAAGSLLMDGLLLENAAGDRLFFRLPESYQVQKKQ